MLYYFLLIFTQLTDWYTTYVGITSGKAKEVNPIMASFISHHDAGISLFLLKLLYGIMFAYFLRNAKVLGWLTIIYFTGVTIHNLTVLY